MLETFREGWVDFMQVSTLCRRAGCSASDLAMVAAKELIDNAYDASPQGVHVRFEGRTLVVHDLGPGLSAEQAAAIFDVRRPSLSSKRWRLAKRGALGNGVRVVMGVVHVSGGSLTVESRGVGMVLDVAMDGATRVLKRFASDVADGARISLTFGPEILIYGSEILHYARLCQAGAGSAYGGRKAVPAWFDAAAIQALVRDAGADTTVMDFAKAFDLTPDALAAIKAAALRTTTAALLRDEPMLDRITRIILSGQNGQRELRRMGRSARVGAYAFAETMIYLGLARVPAIVECWITGTPVLNRKTAGKVSVGTLFANRTPAIMRQGTGDVAVDSKDLVFYLGSVGFRIDGVLRQPCNFDIDLAITAPELPLISDGKAIDIQAFFDPIYDAVAAAAPRAYAPPTGQVPQRERAWTIKDAVYHLIVPTYDAVAAAGIGAPPRMLMYRCRPEILRLTGRNELNYATFNSALQDFMDDHLEKTAGWSILYDDRGHFTEPGGASFGIGTLAVDEFIGNMANDLPRFAPGVGSFDIRHNGGALVDSANPAFRFRAVVFVEKEGYVELIRKARIAERFDVAFASTKGLPNTSIRRLLDKLAEFGVKVFVLHDLDIAGLNIAHTLATSNDRYQFRNILEIVDMGVRLADAEALGLESEPFKPSKSDDGKLRTRLARYGATPAEIEMLVDQHRRIEIDAMTPRQLIDFIERKLADHGISKIVPPEDAMAAHFLKAASEIRIDRAMAPLREEFEARAAAFADELRGSSVLDIDVPPLREAVRLHLELNPDETWREAVAAVAEELGGEG